MVKMRPGTEGVKQSLHYFNVLTSIDPS
ncbi:hypothetical protein E2C01_000166 [Portunus trituberculatus]|uniref:Uncharacterized protein n=1 Tax=Portunus trituberculatus TaxID=210409 RepID=A0A5B7CDD1_PORTR|nr:hypothetical protein [Portunus trituberculatus]